MNQPTHSLKHPQRVSGATGYISGGPLANGHALSRVSCHAGMVQPTLALHTCLETQCAQLSRKNKSHSLSASGDEGGHSCEFPARIVHTHPQFSP